MKIFCDVAVVGGGPAGTTVARGLVRAGHRVVLASSRRPFPSLEAVSHRTASLLRRAGAERALKELGPPLPRLSLWNGGAAEANSEHVVDRQRLDEALRRGAAEAGVVRVDGRVVGVARAGPAGWRVEAATSAGAATIEAGFLIEARGRAAPVEPATSRGPLTVALLGEWETPSPAAPGTAILSFADGWVWLASSTGGRLLIQVVVSAEGRELPPRQKLGPYYDRLVAEIPETSRWTAGALRRGPVRARAAFSSIAPTPAAGNQARVGDAAFAVDPLSGNGIYEAVASAFALVPVTNTLIRRPGDRLLAESFYRERITDAFLRMACAGRDFYRLEERFRDRPFWRERGSWPADDPPQAAGAGLPSIEARPVVEGDTIVLREVVVTAGRPRGVWHVAGVPVVPLLRFASKRGEGREQLAARYAARHGSTTNSVLTALLWLDQEAAALRRVRR